jgi:hypothetical protein
MVRTIATPQNNSFTIAIPKNYIGKEIEFLYYPSVEIRAKKNIKVNSAAKFKGLLDNEEADKYNTYLTQTRSQWERDII